MNLKKKRLFCMKIIKNKVKYIKWKCEKDNIFMNLICLNHVGFFSIYRNKTVMFTNEDFAQIFVIVWIFHHPTIKYHIEKKYKNYSDAMWFSGIFFVPGSHYYHFYPDPIEKRSVQLKSCNSSSFFCSLRKRRRERITDLVARCVTAHCAENGQNNTFRIII